MRVLCAVPSESACSLLSRFRCVAAVASMLVSFSTPARVQAQRALPLGSTVEARLSGDAALEYRLAVPGAGVLTVVADGSGDLVLQLLDADGQPLPDGRADSDLDGVSGRELLSVRITEGGSYRLRISDFEGSGSNFRIGTSFLTFPAFAKAADADGRPSGATSLRIGQSAEDALDPGAGDSRDWFVYTVDSDGTLALATRAVGDSEGLDLVLEAFLSGTFLEPAQRSDQDLQETLTNEGITLAVRAGQQVHVRVSASSSSGGRYRLSSSLLK
jgi:hypothetical protein